MSGSVQVMREIAPSARVADDAQVGPFCVIGPHAVVGPRCSLGRRVSILGRTTLGSDNVLEEGCVLGGAPQDLKYAGGPTLLAVGDRNRFGRFVTAHIGTEDGGHLTRIGSGCRIGSGSHVAHDCFVGDGVEMGRYVLLAGHVLVESGAVLEDFTAAHHFVTVGRFSRVRPRTPIRRDVPPYTEFFSDDPDWKPASVKGVHTAGVGAAGLELLDEFDLLRALGELFADESALQTRIEYMVNLGIEGEALELCRFCQRSLRGVYGRQRELLRGRRPPEAEAYFDEIRRDNPSEGGQV